MARIASQPRQSSAIDELNLDPTSLGLLRSLTTGCAPHPSFGGPAGCRARQRLVDAGALTAEGRLTTAAEHLVEPIVAPRRVLRLHALAPKPQSRQVWIGGARATAAEVLTDGTLTLARQPRAGVGAALLRWLDVRPLPAPEGRKPTFGCAADLAELTDALLLDDFPRAAHQAIDCPRLATRPLLADLVLGDLTAWLITVRDLDRPTSRRWFAAIDAGRDGWRLARGDDASYAVSVPFEPVDITAIYLALCQAR